MFAKFVVMSTIQNLVTLIMASSQVLLLKISRIHGHALFAV